MIKKILYIDMDGVIAQFDGAIALLCPGLEASDKLPNYEERSKLVDALCEEHPNIFRTLDEIEDGIESVKELFQYYDIYFLSTPMWNVPDSFKDKRLWLEEKFGALATKRLVLTHRKDLAIGDYLVDDRLKNGAGEFKGKHIHFGTDKFPNWKIVLEYLKLEYQSYILDYL